MKTYQIKSNNFTTDELVNLLAAIPRDQEEKVLEFEKGEYHIYAEKLPKIKLYITNTVGDNEYEKGEEHHINRTPIHLKNLKNLTINGNGATLVIHGKCSNIVMQNCENITVRNLTITASDPEISKLQVVGKGRFYTDFLFDGDALSVNGRNAWWAIHFPKDKPNLCVRTRHPLYKPLKFKNIGENKIRAYNFSRNNYNIGDEFYIYDFRRDCVGIFAENSKNITLENVGQHFNYSLAFVAQNTENITIDSVNFVPEKCRKLCSFADFLQFCMCRGKITVKSSNFSGAGDDCMNVHGFHFQIRDKDNEKIIVQFKHPQSHGYNAFENGDEIEFINPQTLLPKGHATVLDSKMLSEYYIELTLDKTEDAIVGEFVENITACPDVDFVNNSIEHIVTRGLLITTRGKVNVENNHFGSMGMSGILLSDDANNWFESGACHNVTIKNNTFDYCGENGILIKPENTEYKGAVHKNINIVDNTFTECEKTAFSIKDTDNVKIENNKVLSCPEMISTKNATNLQKDF